MKDNIIIYTDGGCRGNPGLGAWASILISEKYNLRLEIGESYGVLTQSTDAQQTNVVFIYNTPTIDKPAVQEEKTEQEETHWYTRILDLFRRKD